MDKHKSYYTAYSVFVGIPFGIGMLIGWYLFLESYPKTADGFASISGKCQFFGDTSIFSPTKDFPDRYRTYLGLVVNDSLYTADLEVSAEEIRNGAKKCNVNKAFVEVWYQNFERYRFIQQLSIDNKLILEYKGRPYGRSLFFLIPGLVFLIVCSGYLYNRMKENDWFKK